VAHQGLEWLGTINPCDDVNDYRVDGGHHLAREHFCAKPSKSIKLIVGYPPGGASDLAARIIGQKLSERLAQPVVVENRSGSAGNIGAEAVVKAQADGYTLLLGTISLSVNPSLYPKMSYDPVKDLKAISMISSTPFLLVVNPKAPYKSAVDLLDAARGKGGQKPGDINYATAGNGSGLHLFTELLCTTAGIKLTHVPYKGAAPAMNDVLANQVQVAFDNIIAGLPLVFIAVQELGFINSELSMEGKLKIHAICVSLFLIFGHIAMITGMMDPAIFGYQSRSQMDSNNEMSMHHMEHTK
jgi:Tripartite tricarboxylate transporter family receptor